MPAGLFETNIFNNEARSNYSRFVSSSSSPSARVSTEIQLANPFDDSTLVHAVVRTTHEFHRVFLANRWLRVPARSSVPVHILDEALAGFPEADEIGRERVLSTLWKTDNTVSVEGWAARPFESDCGSLTLTGGAAVRVGSGRTTRVRITDASQSFMAGIVENVDDGSPVSDGTVLIVKREVDEFGGQVSAEATVRNDGTWAQEFDRQLPTQPQTGQALYLGGFGHAPCDSEVVDLRR